MLYKKILCTGGNGRLGRYVVKDLEDRYDLTVLDLQEVSNPKVKNVVIDIMDYEGLKKAFKSQDRWITGIKSYNMRTALSGSDFDNDGIPDDYDNCKYIVNCFNTNY
jgi:saccharopine dehydrogenase-like NADP-dependent oxidoreductase